MVVGEVDEEILSGHQLHDGVAQELHPLVVAPGRRKHQEGRVGKRRGGGNDVSGWSQPKAFDWTPTKSHQEKRKKTLPPPPPLAPPPTLEASSCSHWDAKRLPASPRLSLIQQN